jgi:hypothetical protein
VELGKWNDRAGYRHVSDAEQFELRALFVDVLHELVPQFSAELRSHVLPLWEAAAQEIWARARSVRQFGGLEDFAFHTVGSAAHAVSLVTAFSTLKESENASRALDSILKQYHVATYWVRADAIARLETWASEPLGGVYDSLKGALFLSPHWPPPSPPPGVPTWDIRVPRRRYLQEALTRRASPERRAQVLGYVHTMQVWAAENAFRAGRETRNAR